MIIVEINHKKGVAMRYVCNTCEAILNLQGYPVANEIGRKFCDRCDDNEDNLSSVSTDDFNNAVRFRDNTRLSLPIGM